MNPYLSSHFTGIAGYLHGSLLLQCSDLILKSLTSILNGIFVNRNFRLKIVLTKIGFI